MAQQNDNNNNKNKKLGGIVNDVAVDVDLCFVCDCTDTMSKFIHQVWYLQNVFRVERCLILFHLK